MEQLFAGNQLVSGGLVLMAVGAALAYMRSVPFSIYHWIRSRFIFSVQVEGNDVAYDYLLEWIDHHPTASRTKTLILKTKTKSDGENTSIYTPLGTHWIFYKGRLVWFSRSRDRQQNNASVFFYESITIYTISRKRGLIESLVNEVTEEARKRRYDTVQIYTSQSWGGWQELTRRKPRPLSSVILPPQVIQRTMEDVQKYLDTEKWYSSVGIPYRRGYLLYGPPGNGKTSLVFAVASELHKNLSILNLSDTDVKDSDLIDILSKVPKDSILLVEDIDSAFNKRESRIKGSQLSFSGLLNALDGVASSEGRILFMTTNHIDNLDEALIRPGRVDQQVAILPPEVPQIKEMFLRFYPGEEEAAEKFAIKHAPKSKSAAQYQEHFLRYRSLEAIMEAKFK